MKIRRVGAELLHADGETDMTKLTVAVRNFAKAHPPPPQKTQNQNKIMHSMHIRYLASRKRRYHSLRYT